MPEYFENVPQKITVLPCIKCGSSDVELWESGDNSFNSGGGRCLDCKHEVREMLFADPTNTLLAEVWNKYNNVRTRLSVIEKEIRALQAERDRIKRRKV